MLDMMYKLKDGDVVKILPIVKKKGGFSAVEQLNGFYIGEKIIYDTPENYLKAALNKKFFIDNDTKLSPLRLKFNKTVLCIFHEGEIKFTLVGKKMLDIIVGGYKFDPRNNYQLKVNIEMVKASVGDLPSLDKSEIIQQDWDRPNIDIDNQEAWFEWLRANQPFYIEDYVEKNNVYKNIDILKKEGLSDYIYEIISENREKKINQVLT
jgi:hypothetical protein